MVARYLSTFFLKLVVNIWKINDDFVCPDAYWNSHMHTYICVCVNVQPKLASGNSWLFWIFPGLAVGLRQLSLAYSNAEHPGHIYDFDSLSDWHFLDCNDRKKNKPYHHAQAPTSEWWNGRWGTGRKSNVAIENPPVHPFRSMLATKTSGPSTFRRGTKSPKRST